MTGVPRFATPAQRDFDGARRATLADWLVAPTNRWAFRHARELFPSECVPAGAPRALTTGPGDRLIDQVSVDYLTRSHTDALVVLRDDAVVGEWYRPGVSPDDRHILFSVTKSVTGLVAAALLADGILDASALVTDYVPEAAVGGYAAATVREVLDMTAAIDFVEDYDGPDVRRYREAVGQVPSQHSEGIHAFLSTLPRRGAHGSAFNYVSPTADLAGWLCERATGCSLAELISLHVWTPMGAEHSGDLLLDPFGAARASGGLCATARDMARVGRLLLATDPRRREAIADILEPGDAAAWAAGTLVDFLPGATYRNLWYQLPGDPGIFLAAGIHGQRIYIDVPRRVVVAQQASLPTSFDPTTWTETIPTFAHLARMVAGA